jgi:Flp pilus assembly protein TadB
MAETIEETINRCFMMAWDEFGDDKSTEFLVQITADRLGVEPDEVYDALAAVHDDGDVGSPVTPEAKS